MSDDPARWQPDPTGRHDHRYWDGTRWTDDVADAGVASTDPVEPAAEAVSPDAPTVVTPVPADDTAPYPTAAPPPFPAPPPYAPPPPIATGGAAGGGSSKRRLLIGGAILAAVALVVIAIVAFAGDDDEPTTPLADESPETTIDEGDVDTGELPEDLGDIDDLEDMEDALVETYEDMGLSEEQAECLVDRLSELVDDDDLGEEQAMAEVFGLLGECDISMDDLTGPPPR